MFLAPPKIRHFGKAQRGHFTTSTTTTLGQASISPCIHPCPHSLFNTAVEMILLKPKSNNIVTLLKILPQHFISQRESQCSYPGLQGPTWPAAPTGSLCCSLTGLCAHPQNSWHALASEISHLLFLLPGIPRSLISGLCSSMSPSLMTVFETRIPLPHGAPALSFATAPITFVYYLPYSLCLSTKMNVKFCEGRIFVLFMGVSPGPIQMPAHRRGLVKYLLTDQIQDSRQVSKYELWRHKVYCH